MSVTAGPVQRPLSCPPYSLTRFRLGLMETQIAGNYWKAPVNLLIY